MSPLPRQLSREEAEASCNGNRWCQSLASQFGSSQLEQSASTMPSGSARMCAYPIRVESVRVDDRAPMVSVRQSKSLIGSAVAAPSMSRIGGWVGGAERRRQQRCPVGRGTSARSLRRVQSRAARAS